MLSWPVRMDYKGLYLSTVRSGIEDANPRSVDCMMDGDGGSNLSIEVLICDVESDATSVDRPGRVHHAAGIDPSRGLWECRRPPT